MVTIANVQLASPIDRAVKRTLTMGRVHFCLVLVDKQAKREGDRVRGYCRGRCWIIPGGTSWRDIRACKALLRILHGSGLSRGCDPLLRGGADRVWLLFAE